MNVDGKSVKELFSHTPGLAHLNSGSYGASPCEIMEVRRKFIEEFEREADLWLRKTQNEYYHASADLIADTYNAPRANVALVENTTTGIWCILSSLNLGPKDTVLVNSLTYPAIRDQCDERVGQRGINLRVFQVNFPFTHDSILSQYEHELDQMVCEGEGRKLAIINHITSAGALLLPVARIISLCERKNVLSIVDGAHSPGQLTPKDVNIKELRPDFYVANLHKWTFVPRSCGFLYVDEKYLEVIRPEVVSFFHHQSFRNRFLYRGTFDGTVFATIPSAFDFLKRIGGVEAVQEYVVPLIRAGIDLVISRLGGGLVCDHEYSAPYMISIYLGNRFDEKLNILRPLMAQPHLVTLHKLLREEGVVCPTFYEINGRVTMRVSAHVYNDMDDFHKLANGLDAVEKRLRSVTVEMMEAWLQRDSILS